MYRVEQLMEIYVAPGIVPNRRFGREWCLLARGSFGAFEPVGPERPACQKAPFSTKPSVRVVVWVARLWIFTPRCAGTYLWESVVKSKAKELTRLREVPKAPGRLENKTDETLRLSVFKTILSNRSKVVPKTMNCRRVFTTAFSPLPSPCP